MDDITSFINSIKRLQHVCPSSSFTSFQFHSYIFATDEAWKGDFIMSKRFQMLFITSFSAVLVLLWDYLLSFEVALNIYYLVTNSHCEYCLLYIVPLFCFSLPIFGLLADVWVGRHKAVVFGIVLCFLSWIITGIGYIIQCYNDSRVLLVVYGIAYCSQYLGIACFTANIIQYTIDQLVGASADELSTVIYWHCATLPIMHLLHGLVSCFDVHGDLVIFIVSGVAVSLVLVSHSLFKHKLENISLIKNPIKLIVRVLCYARKHKYPENRSALTYWEEEAPSRLDLGKEKYGGPFAEEEVEDVKTIFRMLPLFIAIIGYAFSENFSKFNGASMLVCIIAHHVVQCLCSLLLLIIYLYFIRVFFSKYIPRMLARMSIGLFFAFLSIISKILPLLSITWKTFISELLLGLAYVLINPVSLEFAVAQSPVHSRGMMVGVWYASWEVGITLSFCITLLFDCHNEDIHSCLYYYLTKAFLLLIILTVFVILAKHYKYRVRENEVNIHQIVDGTYQNYIQQEEEYKRNNQS